jgi:hypothetical protein
MLKASFTEAISKTSSFVSTRKDIVDDETEKIKTAFNAGVNAYKETKNQNIEQV